MECVACQTELHLAADEGHGECHVCGASYYLSNTWVLPAFAVSMKPILEGGSVPTELPRWTLSDESVRVLRDPRWSLFSMGRKSRVELDRARLQIEHRAKGLFGFGGIDDRVAVPTARVSMLIPVRRHEVISDEDHTAIRFVEEGAVFALTDEAIERDEGQRPLVRDLPLWLKDRLFLLDEIERFDDARAVAAALNRTLQRWSTGYR